MQKNYFITGGAGFIGAHIVNFLLDNTKSKITTLKRQTDLHTEKFALPFVEH